MIELGTALAASLGALGWAVWTGRALLRRGAVGRSRPARFGSVSASVQALLRPSFRALAAIAGLVAFVAFVAFGVVRPHSPADPTPTALSLGAWLAVAFLLGTVTSALAVHLATWSALRLVNAPAAQTAPATRVGLVASAASIGALLPASVSLLVILALCAAALALTGGLVAGGAATAVPAWSMARLVVALGAGAALGALFSKLAAGWLRASLPAAPPSPGSESARTALAEVVAFGAQHTVDLTSSWTLVGVSALLPAVSLASTHAASLHSPGSVALYPLVVLAFTLLSSAVSTMLIRGEEGEPALKALLRGLTVCGALCAGSLLGVAYWLFDTLWAGPFYAGLGGLGCAVATLLVGGSLGVDDAAARTSGMRKSGWLIGSGFERAAAQLVVAMLCVFGGAQLVAWGSMHQAGSFGAAAAVLGFLAPAPFVAVAGGFGSLDKLSADRTGRDTEASPTGVRVVAASRAYAASAALLAGMLALHGYSFLAASYAGVTRPADGGVAPSSVIVVAAVSGLALVMLIAGRLFRTATAVTREGATSESDTSTSAASGVAETTRRASHAVRQGIASTLVICGLSAAGWLLVKGMTARAGAQATIESTSAWLLVVVVLGAALSAALGGAASDPTPSRKSAVDGPPDSANNPFYGAAVVNDQLGIPFGYVAGPALHAIARLLPAVAVALAPLVH